MKLLEPKNGENLTLEVKENEELLIMERGEGKYSINLTLKPNAKVKYFSLTTGNATRKALLGKDATILWVDAAHGTGESHTHSSLEGEGADAEFHSVLFGTGTDKFKVTSEMDHKASHTTSNMLTRAVMLCESHGEYSGTIRIAPNAKNCDAYQKEDTLLLSEEARMDAEPNLEIQNEDVRCSHGVSIGQLDEEKLFYLKSRGIPQDVAVKLVINGFFDEVLDKMGEHSQEVKEELLKRFA
ncbi:SufD family Fe-S cluster assembly protein [Candidatus Woesearchaeota archaeon]|nr:SufD family Fe-S cluster assembly protein [Candidatus Woesearchaeota archaeon]